MAISNELFLLSCINHSINDKIDFTAVAQECAIPTKNAAWMRFKRFKRFKDQHNLSLLNNAQGDKDGEADDDDSEVPKPPKTPTNKGSTGAKKRKVE